jgi:hypothetical protein
MIQKKQKEYNEKNISTHIHRELVKNIASNLDKLPLEQKYFMISAIADVFDCQSK